MRVRGCGGARVREVRGCEEGAGVRVKRVLIVATTTGYQTRTFGAAAERQGIDLITPPIAAISLTIRGVTASSRCGSTKNGDRSMRS